MRLHPSVLLFMAMLGGCAAQASNADGVPIPEAQRLFADLDGDGGRDEVLLETNPRMGDFVVRVRHDNEDIYPFGGDWLPGDRAGLEWRVGDLASDVRCRGWQPGKKCGHALGTHMPTTALVVHHSRLGEYVLTPSREYARPSGKTPAPLRFNVSKAYETTTALNTYGS